MSFSDRRATAEVHLLAGNIAGQTGVVMRAEELTGNLSRL